MSATGASKALCGVAAVLCGAALAQAQPAANEPSAAPSLAEVNRHRAALIAQCPPSPAVDDEKAAELPIHVVRWGAEGPRVLIIHGGVQGRLGGGPDTFAKQEGWGPHGSQCLWSHRPGCA